MAGHLINTLLLLLCCGLLQFTAAQSVPGDTKSSANVIFTLTKEYIESYQGLFQKLLIKEAEEMVLRDVRVQQKSDHGRLTSLMKDVTLADFNLQDSHFTVDFQSEAIAQDTHDCITDFGMTIKVTGISMVFEFDQWLEVESN